MLFLARRALAQRTVVTAKLAVPARRSITVSALRRAGHGGPVVIQGEGGAVGKVPSDLEQATGLERMELLGKLQGEDPFHMEPLEVDFMGTKQKPVKVFSLDNNRIVGCTGFPIDSHDTLYGKVTLGTINKLPQ
ncbi:MAG: Cytochrome c oxidase subunit 4 [Cyphobasidiales sp. Tagirdzhanova-0007]|nr:MAG: Cytochrome c oxidase subunit 4 [Cyphobasidiales sp. Tagirdzhanova-0007]